MFLSWYLNRWLDTSIEIDHDSRFITWLSHDLQLICIRLEHDQVNIVYDSTSNGDEYTNSSIRW
jgi:hypothetical protein